LALALPGFNLVFGGRRRLCDFILGLKALQLDDIATCKLARVEQFEQRIAIIIMIDTDFTDYNATFSRIEIKFSGNKIHDAYR
jgi:hypothetical protein